MNQVDHTQLYKDFLSNPNFRPLIMQYPISMAHEATLELYRDRGFMPGQFLLAVLDGDLFEAFGRADEESKLCLPAIVTWVVANMPIGSYGSPETRKAWYNERHN